MWISSFPVTRNRELTQNRRLGRRPRVPGPHRGRSIVAASFLRRNSLSSPSQARPRPSPAPTQLNAKRCNIREGSHMKRLTPIPPDTAADLKLIRERNWIRFIRWSFPLRLKDQRCFDQVVVSEGCIIAVKGYPEVPFQFDEVLTVTVNHKRWNFRNWTDKERHQLKRASATA